jgi:acetyl-CoA acyltransferase
MNERVIVSGIGMSPFGRSTGASTRQLATGVLLEALQDAGAELADIDMVFVSNAVEGSMYGQEMIRGEIALRHLGLKNIPVVNVENACASGSTAVYLARQALLSGEARSVAVVGVERLTHPERSVSFRAINTAVDIGELDGLPEDRSVYMELYAGKALKAMHDRGVTSEDIALVSVKNHAHGALNPLAQYGGTMTVQQVLESRMVSNPLTVLMCAPFSDGAAALILTREDSSTNSSRATVEIKSMAIRSGRDSSDAESAAQSAATAVYENTGFGPQDLDVVELHDATASAELDIYEEVGLARPGEAVTLLRSGATSLGGRVPVNTSGGLVSKGHPIGASGVAQIYELTKQLRHEAGARQVQSCRIGLAHNAGGWIGTDSAVGVVSLLERV